MAILKVKIGKQGTWPQAFLLLISPLLILFTFRWLLYEPFVIPSGSMEPNLLKHDHLFVNKYSYGIKSPIGQGWLINFSSPQRGDVIVFKYPENKKVYFIKRLIGVPGDRIYINNGQVTVNGKPWKLYPTQSDQDNNKELGFDYFIESVADDTREHFIKMYSNQATMTEGIKEFIVPQKSYFVMGDNRNESHDSRYWGFVNHNLLVGRASIIWLSCENTLETAPMICDPSLIRLNRLFKQVR